MNYFILRYILFFSVLNFSVAHSQNPVIINAGKSINNEKILDLTEIAGEITYVPLETSNESLISHIDKIKFFENNIFIETFNPERLLRFNKKGEFLNSIGREGRGPNEYATLGSFGINKSESEIYI